MEYIVEFNGRCMGELIQHGSILRAVPGEDIRPLDLVSVLLVDFAGPWANFINSISSEGYAGLVKVFLGIYEVNGEHVFLFGQLNPPNMVPIPMSTIAAIHKLDFTRECTGSDLAALSLLTPFAGIGVTTQKETA